MPLIPPSNLLWRPIFLCVVGSSFGELSYKSRHPLVVETTCGPVRGTLETWTGAVAFLGIPYAMPPVGVRRWQPPEGLSRGSEGCWAGVLNATSWGPACLQGGRYGLDGGSSEDCLKLHIHTKNLELRQGSDDVTLKPVLVWLHGGDLVEGSPSSLQSGFGAQANLTIDNDVVVVSLQYRLGVAGFLALDALARQHDVRGTAGNYGLLDCLEALRWIRENIQSFGGDPARVTVWGQSSGGSLVFALLASPMSHGLIHGGISMSGSPRLNSTVAEASRYWHRDFVARTRCSSIGFSVSQEKRLLECLLRLNGTELVKAMPPDWTADLWSFSMFESTFRYAPLLVLDGSEGVLPKDYLTRFASTDPPGVPLVIGVTREESDFSPGQDVRSFNKSQLADFIRVRLQSIYGERFVHELLTVYGLALPPTELTWADAQSAQTDADKAKSASWQPQQLYAQILSDATTVCPNMYLAGRMANFAAYLYVATRHLDREFCVLRKFSRLSPRYCSRYAFHAVDEFAMIGPSFSDASFPYRFTAADIAYGQRLKKRLLEFATTGAIRAWSKFQNGTWDASQFESRLDRTLPDNYSVVDLGPLERVVPGYLRQRCNFWLTHGFYDSRGLINEEQLITRDLMV